MYVIHRPWPSLVLADLRLTGYSQIDGNLGTVAAGMTLKGTPNDLIQLAVRYFLHLSPLTVYPPSNRNLNPISIIVMIPIFDRIIYPFLRKMGINFSPIKRIYAGFLVAGLGKFPSPHLYVSQRGVLSDDPYSDGLGCRSRILST